MPVDTRQSHYGGEEGPMLKRGYSIKYRRIYKIWQGIRQRCNNPNDKDYEDYGGRGIRVCEEWDKSSEAFVRWALENGYDDNLSIDRIDTNSGYSPENCRWATWTQQARNKRIEKINSTGVAGVSMDRGKYRAIIYVNNKKVDLGRHDTLEEAAEARRQGEIKYWGVSA